MNIDWDGLSVKDWYAIYNRIPKTNLIQSYAYARAMRQLRFRNTRFGVISGGSDIQGLVQMQEIRLLGLHLIMIDRAPLWLDGGTAEKEAAFWGLIARNYPKTFTRRRRFLPETADAALMEELGFCKIGKGYQTIWLDLTPDLDVLRKNLNAKWRNKLSQAEKSGLNISIPDDAAYLEMLLKCDLQARRQKTYRGASPAFIRALERFKSPHEYGFVVKACAPDQSTPCALMYFFIHGTSATYQIGWGDDIARKTRAHHAMIWQAIEYLKNRNISRLDLGGINPDTAGGVTRFKQGLGGSVFESAGMYR